VSATIASTKRKAHRAREIHRDEGAQEGRHDEQAYQERREDRRRDGPQHELDAPREGAELPLHRGARRAFVGGQQLLELATAVHGAAQPPGEGVDERADRREQEHRRHRELDHAGDVEDVGIEGRIEQGHGPI
jgi:hypothetical protein